MTRHAVFARLIRLVSFFWPLCLERADEDRGRSTRLRHYGAAGAGDRANTETDRLPTQGSWMGAWLMVTVARLPGACG